MVKERAFYTAALLCGLLLCCLPLRPRTAQAHAVYLFAWPENGRICTESYFSRSSKVRGGTVRMEDSAGSLLASGLTDERGGICFAVPTSAQDLHFSVAAGQGHRAEFLLPASSVAEALGSGGPASAAPAVAPDAPAVVPDAPAVAPDAPAVVPDAPAVVPDEAAVVPDALRAILREELQRELSPLHKALASVGRDTVRDEGPRVRDIVGGLGWIVGLAGLGALLAARRKKD